MLSLLAERLSGRVSRESSRFACWRAIDRAIRLASIQGIHVLIAIDDCESASRSLRDIDALANLPAGSSAPADRHSSPPPRSGMAAAARGGVARRPWPLAAHTFADRFLSDHQARGRRLRHSRLHPPRVTRLHCAGAGVPRAIDHIATRCLMTGSAQDLEMISPELVDALAEE